MDTPPSKAENPEGGASAATKSRIGGSEDQDSVGASRSRPILKVLVAGILIIAVGVAVYFLAIYPRVENRKELVAAAAAAGKTTVTVVEPTQTSSAPELVLPGNVTAYEMASIYSRVDGYLKKWYVDIGDHVQQGQVLADVEAPQIDAELRMAQAQLELAEANLTLAQTNSARSQELYQNHVNSQKELDTVLATEKVQKATRDNAAAALTSAQDMKAFEQIRAPFAGTITARYIDVGSLVSSGSSRTVQKLFDLAQSDPVRVFVNVPQADVSSVQAGTPATITVDEFPDQTFAGKVARDAGAFDLSSRTLLLEIEVPNPHGLLYAGMYAHAKFALKNPTPALLVPDNSILIDSKGARVLAVDSSNKIRVKPVTLGRDFGTKSEILGGLNATDRVVQNPTLALQEGMPVSVESVMQGASK
ncbi:MAG TPA: efflux RND transporter periplasmic adaptor subunit [Chthoniobacterales bacterium]|nr:efflux RND transporter periplasmic adaptor subunit [Chthoniobacterales bacterium]